MRLSPLSHRTLIARALVALPFFTLISCTTTDALGPLAPGDASALLGSGKTITISAADSSLTPGQQVQVTSVAIDQSGTLRPQARITWSVAPTDIATVSSTGLVTAGSTTGSATVTATWEGGAKATLPITVAPASTSSSTPSAPVHMVSITANATSLKIGEVTQVSGIVRDINGAPISGVPITWSTSPATVATAATTSPSTGLVTATGVGTATLYAKADTAIRSITITVIDSATTTASTPTAPATGGASGASYGSATAAELPRVTVNTSYPSAVRQIRVPAGANLQNAIDAAQPGDELLLAPGATYLGNFYLPNKGSSSGWVTIRTDLSDAAIGSPGTRMTPSRAAGANLAKILTPNIYSTLTTDISAHHYRFTGVEIGTTSSVADINAIVRFGDNTTAQNSASTTANNLILDRTYIHGTTTGSVRRCIMLNSASTAVVDSWVSECHSNNGDSQAIVGWNGPGPFLIQNNYLDAGHEVIMFGGGGMTIPNASPSDITIRGNHITRPSSWKGVWQVKNLIESKHARRLLIEGNVIENTWMDSQVGYAFVMKSENQNWDTPWTQTTDVTVRYNKIRNVGAGFNLAANPSGAPAVPAARFVITDNVMENVGNAPYLGDGRIFQFLGGLTDIVAMHNTLVSANGSASSAMYFGSLPSIQRLVVHSNVLAHGGYGVKGDSYGEGSPTLNVYAPSSLFTNNAVAGGGTASTYPTNNFFPATLGNVGFANFTGGDYHLSASSPYAGKGYDGREIGADINQVDAQTRNAVVAP
jgi:Bacterial Ig-like domain (group 2)